MGVECSVTPRFGLLSWGAVFGYTAPRAFLKLAVRTNILVVFWIWGGRTVLGLACSGSLVFWGVRLRVCCVLWPNPPKRRRTSHRVPALQKGRNIWHGFAQTSKSPLLGESRCVLQCVSLHLHKLMEARPKSRVGTASSVVSQGSSELEGGFSPCWPFIFAPSCRYCGERSQFVVASTTNKIEVRFHSDQSYTDTGFSAEYLSYDSSDRELKPWGRGGSKGDLGGLDAVPPLWLCFHANWAVCFSRGWKNVLFSCKPPCSPALF